MRGLAMFRTTKKADEGPAPTEMRGRAAEITDPGRLGWQVLWEVLKTEAPQDDPSTLTQELGLEQEREISTAWGGSNWATEFSGIRHGRQVALRIGIVPRISGKGYNEVHLAASVAPFRLGVSNGRPTVEDGASAAIQEVLEGLAPAPDAWRGLEVESGSGGIVARRPVTAHPQGYLYDLWLIERIADRLGS
jgi:hypothetical protein